MNELFRTLNKHPELINPTRGVQINELLNQNSFTLWGKNMKKFTLSASSTSQRQCSKQYRWTGRCI